MFLKMIPYARQMLDLCQNYLDYKLVIYTAGNAEYSQFMRCVLTSWGLDVVVTLHRADCGRCNEKFLEVVRKNLLERRGIKAKLEDMVMLENRPEKVVPRHR